MNFSAIIFDLDGTLLDSLEDIADSMNAALTRLGYSPHPLEKYKYFVGDGIEFLARRVLPQSQVNEANIAACIAAMREEYLTRRAEKTRPFAEIPELLDELAGRGLKLAVFSNKPDDFTKTIVAELLPKWHFSIVLGGRAGIPKKPDPAGAVEIAKHLELPPSRIAFLGDTNIDIRAAIGAGMFPVGCLWGFRPEEVRDSGAKALLESPLGLLKLLDARP